MNIKLLTLMGLLSFSACSGFDQPDIRAKSQIKSNDSSNSDLSHVNRAILNIQNKVHFDFQVGSGYVMGTGGELDVRDAYLGARASNSPVSFRTIVDQLGFRSDQVKTIFEFTFKFTTIPWLVEGSTKEALAEKVDLKIANTRAEMIPLVKAQVAAGLAANPAYVAAPVEVQDQIRAQAEAGAITSLDTQLDAAGVAKKNEIDGRVSDLKMETSFQEFAMVIGKVFSTGMAKDDLVLYVKAGKFKINHGPRSDENSQTQLESIRPGNSRVQRGGAVAPTVAVGLGLAKILKNTQDDRWVVRAELYLFHDRVGFISGQDYVGTVVSMETPLYEKHLDTWEIDSGLARVLLQNKDFDFYVSVGKYDDKNGFSTGLTYRITEKDKLYIDYFDGDRTQLKRGLSAFLSHDFSRNLTAYIGYERIDDSYQPTEFDGTQDLEIESVGISWNAAELVEELVSDTRMGNYLSRRTKRYWDLQINFEGSNVHEQTQSLKDGEKELYIGLNYTVRYF